MNRIDSIRAGELRAVARALTCVENDSGSREALIDELFPLGGRALVWGVTGAPGSGKSTLVDRLITRLRGRGSRVGVIAVDPSSPFSGGAILGDRLRMQSHAEDEGVFIRSMASRGYLGGVSGATGDAVRVLDAAGFDYIIIETIGVGQTEIEVMGLSDLVLLILVPGMGDEIQALKAGVMEIGDLFVINKSDKDEARKIRAEVDYVLDMKYAENPQDKNPVAMTAAALDQGVDDLLEAIDAYTEKLRSSGRLEKRRRDRLSAEIHRILAEKIESQVRGWLRVDERTQQWVDAILDGVHPPYRFIQKQLDSFFREAKVR
ncbi:MAG TPA: methylmalonyl Co-A mutase-associated GTPase MeaB [bacterium]|mgnify:CR=1 FL=1|nr:methylmalonyl Co-A mutase-associated GTPase MeaB [bacterium]